MTLICIVQMARGPRGARHLPPPEHPGLTNKTPAILLNNNLINTRIFKLFLVTFFYYEKCNVTPISQKLLSGKKILGRGFYRTFIQIAHSSIQHSFFIIGYNILS